MRLAVIGTGVMGKNHVRVASTLRPASLAGIYDVDRAAARDVARRYGVLAYASPHDALRDPRVEAVVIAAPTRYHHALAVQALEAGKHVLVEKPMAPTVREAEDMVRRARRAGRVLAVGHVERHNPIVGYAHNALRRGDFGEAIHLAARRVSNFPSRVRDVGVVMDLGIHDIDVIRYLAGDRVRRVYATVGRFTRGVRFEDHAFLLLNFRKGLTGSVEVNWLTPRKVRRISITASRCYVDLDYIDQRAIVASSSIRAFSEANAYPVPLDLHERVVQLKPQEPLRLELEDFLLAAAGRRARPLAAGEDGVEAVRIAQAAQRSGRLGRAVLMD